MLHSIRPSPRRVPGYLLAVSMLLGALTPLVGQAAGAPFVSAAGPELRVGSQPWVAVGANVWDLDPLRALANDAAGCYYQHADIDSYLDSTFLQLAGQAHASVARTFGFMAQYTAGGRNWSATDKLVYYAQKHNVRLIAVLGNQYPICGSVPKPNEWYHCGSGCTPGYRQVEPTWGTSYRSYAIAVARRYRASPTIAFWQLMNEPDPAVAGATFDPGALVDFARDMTTAIKTEAGDTNHLIQLGSKGATAVGTLPPVYGRLLECPGACTDLAEAHVYDSAVPLPGSPLTSSVTARLDAWNGAGEHVTRDATAMIDAWSTVALTLPTDGKRYDRWALRLIAPASAGWSAYIDDVRVRTGATAADPVEQRSGFESGMDGMTAQGATLTRTQRQASEGSWSLQATTGASSGATITLAGADPGDVLQSVNASVRMHFSAPAPDVATIASNLHSAVVGHRKPFIIGEAGMRAAVPGVPGCPGTTPTARADRFASMLGTMMDEDHQAAGFVVWDFKDPNVPTLNANGAGRTDPGLSCWSVTPGDPALAALRTVADRNLGVPALPQPATLPAPSWSIDLLGQMPGALPIGGDVRLLVRVTYGGNFASGAQVNVTGACVGSTTADGLGHANLSCAVTGEGPGTVTISLDAAQCGCTPPSQSYNVIAKTAFVVQARGGVAERGAPAPVRISVTDPAGRGAVDDVPWSIPGCSTSGVIPSRTVSITLDAACPTGASWNGLVGLTFSTPEMPSALPTTTGFQALAFERIYVDRDAEECAGLALSAALVGATGRRGACTASSFGMLSDWFTLPIGPRSNASAGDAVTIAAGQLGNRLDGVFSTSSRTFAAVVTRQDGPHPIRST